MSTTVLQFGAPDRGQMFFVARQHTDARDNDIAILSVCPSVTFRY